MQLRARSTTRRHAASLPAWRASTARTSADRVGPEWLRHDREFSYAAPRRADKRDPERAPEQRRKPPRGEGSAQRDCQTLLALPSLGAEASAGCGRQRRCNRGGRGRGLGRRVRARLGSEVHAGRLTVFANFHADPSIRLGDGIAAQPGPYDAATMRTGDVVARGAVRDRREVGRSVCTAGAIPCAAEPWGWIGVPVRVDGAMGRPGERAMRRV